VKGSGRALFWGTNPVFAEGSDIKEILVSFYAQYLVSKALSKQTDTVRYKFRSE